MAEPFLQAKRSGKGALGTDALIVKQSEQGHVTAGTDLLVGIEIAGERAFFLEAVHHADQAAVEMAVVEMVDRGHGEGGIDGSVLLLKPGGCLRRKISEDDVGPGAADAE